MVAGHPRTNLCRTAGARRALLLGAALSFAPACGGDDGAPARRSGASVGTDGDGVSPGDRVQLGGGQTSDFGDGLNTACDYVTDTLERDAALALGWPVDADLALLQPLASVSVQRERPPCADGLDPAGTLRLESELIDIHVARGTPIPEAGDRVECDDMPSYAVDIRVSASDGWIAGLFHAEFARDGERLYGQAFEAAERAGGRLALRVDRARPHLARVTLSLEFSRSGARGVIDLVTYYGDGLEPVLDSGEKLLWPASDGAACSGEVGSPDGSGSEWISIDAYRAGAPAQ